MTLEELIIQENLKRKINNPRLIFINYKYQGPGCKMFNLYYADLLPIEPKEFLRDYKRYGDDYGIDGIIYSRKNLKLDSEFSKEVFEDFINETSFVSIFPGNHDTNQHKKYRIVGKDDVVFNHECSEFSKETFNEAMDAYTFIPDLETAIESEENATFTLKNVEDKDIYGSALLDGCSPIEAYAIVLGVEVSVDKIPYMEGHYELSQGYREYLENCFRVGDR